MLIFMKSVYKDEFKDFLPDSGCYLKPEKYPEIVNRTNWLLKVEKGGK